MALDYTHIKGDTFDGATFEIKFDNVAVNLTGVVIRMQLRRNPEDASAALSITSVASAGITITNAVSGQFRINKQIIDIPVGKYCYDMQFTFTNGDVKTYVDGNFTITPEITR